MGQLSDNELLNTICPCSQTNATRSHAPVTNAKPETAPVTGMQIEGNGSPLRECDCEPSPAADLSEATNSRRTDYRAAQSFAGLCVGQSSLERGFTE